MNILYTNFHLKNGGGHDTYIKSLVDCNADSYVACPAISVLYSLLQKTGHKRLIAMDFPSKLTELKSVLHSVKQFKDVIESYNIDVVHTNGSADNRIALYTKFFCKKPFKAVFTKHNPYPVKGIISRLRLTKFNDAIIFVSRSIFSSIGFGIKSNKIFVIKNGVDIHHWSNNLSDNEYLNLMSDKKLCFVSNAGTADYKGWHHLVNAVKLLPPSAQNKIKIVIIGHEHSQYEKNKLYGDLLQDVVSFVGFQEDCRPFLRQADIGFVLSTCETISFACREMMAFSLPVLVSDSGGLPENVTNGKNGWIVEAGNVDAVLAFLLNILKVDKLPVDDIRANLLPLKRMARAEAENTFRLSKMCDETTDVYQSIK